MSTTDRSPAECLRALRRGLAQAAAAAQDVQIACARERARDEHRAALVWARLRGPLLWALAGEARALDEGRDPWPAEETDHD